MQKKSLIRRPKSLQLKRPAKHFFKVELTDTWDNLDLYKRKKKENKGYVLDDTAHNLKSAEDVSNRTEWLNRTKPWSGITPQRL